VKGTVRDAQTGKPLRAATASLTERQDTIAAKAVVIGGVCDNDGDFELKRVVVGRAYILRVRYIGYVSDSGRVVIVEGASEELDLGDILLDVDTINITDVIVDEKRPDVTVMADKTVYAVAESGMYTANNVSELLGQIPMVFVDQDGDVSLRGDNNVQIMMNGRPLNMPSDQRNKFLESLPMSAVKDIEVRLTPGAQFDASSSGGIINIVTKRTMSDMLGGTVDAGVNSRAGADASIGLYYNEGGLSASLSGGHNRGANRGSNTTTRINYLDSIDWRDEGASKSKSSNSSMYTFGQLDYSLYDKGVASISFYLSKWTSDNTSQGYRSFYDIEDNLTATFNDINETEKDDIVRCKD